MPNNTKPADDDIFNDNNIPASNWFKFDKVGDKVGGVIVSRRDKGAVGSMPAQITFVLKNVSGIMNGVAFSEAEMNVGVKDNDFFRPRLAKTQPGDKLGFHFKEEIPSRVKGNHAAKSIQPFHVPLNADERKKFEEDAIFAGQMGDTPGVVGKGMDTDKPF